VPTVVPAGAFVVLLADDDAVLLAAESRIMIA
jgi:hypothetical protein